MYLLYIVVGVLVLAGIVFLVVMRKKKFSGSVPAGNVQNNTQATSTGANTMPAQPNTQIDQTQGQSTTLPNSQTQQASPAPPTPQTPGQSPKPSRASALTQPSQAEPNQQNAQSQPPTQQQTPSTSASPSPNFSANIDSKQVQTNIDSVSSGNQSQTKQNDADITI